ncbi:hypothetical protein SAMN05421743_12167 [Thalassobacillus cyri]|uniref:Uncharacterized protein n=1 Tax=Thalassobacillus cyri TaxID=571932 RepID=A0A1H4H4I9_9BACI|nr:hypothetical protein [Thalassobacillus cyri]SEB15952.1 hypothetical protein SAMN05421743_12167 [Thalassobacillus cyri]
MAKFRHVYTDFWEDANVTEEMTPEDKLFYLYLLTNPSTTQIGIYQITKKRVAFELGYSMESVNSLFDRFINYHKVIRYNPETREIAIKNWGKYNLNRGGKPVIDCITKELKEVKDQTLILYIAEHVSNDSIKPLFDSYDETRYEADNDSCNDSSNHTSHDTDTTRGQKEKEKEKEKEYKESRDSSRKTGSKEYAPSSIYYKMAERLYERILKNNPEHKEPNYQKWADDFRKLVEIDQRNPEKVIRMIDWAQSNEFWHTNILSPDKLRKQWDRLKLEVVREAKGGKPGGRIPERHRSDNSRDKDYSSGRKHLLG